MGEEKKRLDQLIFPNNIQYHQEHIWTEVKEEEVIIGISDFAQDQLGEIVFLELPGVGDRFGKGEVFGQAESAKSVSALYMPVSGEILAVNEHVADSPELANKDPYGSGWLVAVQPDDLTELQELLSKEEYIRFLQESQDVHFKF